MDFGDTRLAGDRFRVAAAIAGQQDNLFDAHLAQLLDHFACAFAQFVAQAEHANRLTVGGYQQRCLSTAVQLREDCVRLRAEGNLSFRKEPWTSGHYLAPAYFGENAEAGKGLERGRRSRCEA